MNWLEVSEGQKVLRAKDWSTGHLVQTMTGQEDQSWERPRKRFDLVFGFGVYIDLTGRSKSDKIEGQC